MKFNSEHSENLEPMNMCLSDMLMNFTENMKDESIERAESLAEEDKEDSDPSFLLEYSGPVDFYNLLFENSKDINLCDKAFIMGRITGFVAKCFGDCIDVKDNALMLLRDFAYEEIADQKGNAAASLFHDAVEKLLASENWTVSRKEKKKDVK